MSFRHYGQHSTGCFSIALCINFGEETKAVDSAINPLTEFMNHFYDVFTSFDHFHQSISIVEADLITYELAMKQAHPLFHLIFL